MKLWQLVLISMAIAFPLSLFLSAWIDDMKISDAVEQGPRQATIQTLDGLEWQIWYSIKVGGYQDAAGADSRLWLQQDPWLTQSYFIYFQSSSGEMERFIGSYGEWIFAKCSQQEELTFMGCMAEKNAEEDFERDYPLFFHLSRVTRDTPGAGAAEAQNILDQILVLEGLSGQ